MSAAPNRVAPAKVAPAKVAPAKVATIRPLDIFARADWVALTRVSRWRGAWLVAHAWLVVLTTIAATLWLWSVAWPLGLLATPVALAIIGGRQLGLAILMHDAAHGLLLRNRKGNNRLGQWLCAAPVGAGLHAYRADFSLSEMTFNSASILSCSRMISSSARRLTS